MLPISRAVSSFARPSFCRATLRSITAFTRPQPERLTAVPLALRNYSSSSFPDAKPNIIPTKPHRPAPHRDPDTPVYELTFTCRPCKERSSHTVSKQGYHKGTTLIKCPACKNLHLISDHLHIFTDKATTLADLLREKNESMQRGSIDTEGNIEFWEDTPSTDTSPADETPKAIGSP